MSERTGMFSGGFTATEEIDSIRKLRKQGDTPGNDDYHTDAAHAHTQSATAYAASAEAHGAYNSPGYADLHKEALDKHLSAADAHRGVERNHTRDQADEADAEKGVGMEHDATTYPDDHAQVAEAHECMACDHAEKMAKGGPGSGPRAGSGPKHEARAKAASAEARAASAQARASGTPLDHLTAMRAHQEAAQVHRASAKEFQRQGYNQGANAHRAAADEHKDKVSYHAIRSTISYADLSPHEREARDRLRRAEDTGDLEKGGPGSGPHGTTDEQNKASGVAHQASVKASTVSAEVHAGLSTHGQAARAHEAAMKAHYAAAAKYEQPHLPPGSRALGAGRAVEMHEQMAASHDAAASFHERMA